MPRNVAFTPDGNEIVIVHRDTDNITFFDVATYTATHTVAVGDYPVDVAVTPDGQYAVVPNMLDNSVSIVDVAEHALVATVAVTGVQPYKVAPTPDSNYVVVGVINDGVSSSFSVIDLNAQAEILSFPSAPQGAIGWGWTPESGILINIFTQFALAPDGTTIVQPDLGGSRVLLYDRTTGVELADLPTAASPTAVDISADGTRAVISHEGTVRTITEIDLVTHSVAGTVATVNDLWGQVIRITPDNSYAIAAISNNVVFVNLTTGVTTATLSTGTVGDIELSFDGQYAFVSHYNSRVIDVNTQSPVATMPFAASADSATSPTELRAVALNNRFSEDVHFYNIDGVNGAFEAFASSGPAPEGDSTHAVDISADGTTAVACNIVSRNVAIIDLQTDTVRSYADVGDRPKEVRITPDGNYAVVCAMDANAVVIVDLSTDTVAATIPISNRPGRVRISPDSQSAYVLNVAGADRISFIHLDGANSFIISQLPAGQTGSASGPTYSETSGIELSADGATLAVCDSFNDLLRLYDTAARTQVAAVPVGDFPLRVAFSADGTRAYVANHFSHDVSVVNVNGAGSSLLATVPGIANYPLTVSVDATGSFVYVGTRSASGGADAIRVIDASSYTVVATVPLTDGYPRDSYLSPSDAILYVAATNGELVRIAPAGPISAILDTTPLTSGPSDMAFCQATQVAVVAQPIPDGVDVLRLRAIIPGDFDGDGDVQLDDYARFAACLAGPDQFILPGCGDADIDCENDADLADFAAFQAAFTGP